MIWSVCLSWPKSFSHWQRTEGNGDGGGAGRKICPFHPSCPFRGRENLTWSTWAHLVSLANRKCPLQLFFGRGGGGGGGSMTHHACLWFLTWKTKIDITNVLWYLSNWPGIPLLGPPGGFFLFVLSKWLCSCCHVPRLAIRTYWPFSQECTALKSRRVCVWGVGGVSRRRGERS